MILLHTFGDHGAARVIHQQHESHALRIATDVDGRAVFDGMDKFDLGRICVLIGFGFGELSHWRFFQVECQGGNPAAQGRVSEP